MRAVVKKVYRSLPFKQPVFEVMRRTTRLPERVYRHLHFRGPFTIQTGEDTSFRVFHYGHQVENDLFWAGFGKGWEATSLKVWIWLAKNAGVVLDIGANTGIFSLAAQSVNPSARVIAFEPVEQIAAKLSNNISLNGYQTKVVIAGASDKSGEAIIYVPDTEHSYSASLDPSMLSGLNDLKETSIEIKRIDEFAKEADLGGIDLVKLDAEKHEEAVLAGFGSLIREYRPVFLIEILDRQLGRKVSKFFEGLDYRYYDIAEGKGLTPVEELGVSSRNFLICPQERQSEIEDSGLLLTDPV